MSIRLYKSYTPGTRNRALSAFTEITKAKPERSLIQKNHRSKGAVDRLRFCSQIVISHT